jgi:hypothetical protein
MSTAREKEGLAVVYREERDEQEDRADEAEARAEDAEQALRDIRGALADVGRGGAADAVRACETISEIVDAALDEDEPETVIFPDDPSPCAWLLADDTGLLFLDGSASIRIFLDGVGRDADSVFDSPPDVGLWFWEGQIRPGEKDPGHGNGDGDPYLETKSWRRCSVRNVLDGDEPAA